MEFKVGKWYRNKAWKDSSYAKFRSIDSVFRYSEKIYNNTFEKEVGSWSLFNHEWEEVLLEEIQQYLPEGHPDKIKTSIFDGLIEGEYYRYQYKEPELFTISICKKTNTNILSENLCPQSKYYIVGAESAAKSVHLATPEEREWLDACIAAGKYVDKPEKCYVGDWVHREWKRGGDIDLFKIEGFFGDYLSVDPSFYFRNGKILEDSSTHTFAVNSDKRVIDRKALPHEIPKQEQSHTHDAVRYMCKTIIQPSNNLTPDKNEHKINNPEIKSLSIREEHISISGIERPRIESIRSEGSKVEITKYDRQAGIRSVTG